MKFQVTMKDPDGVYDSVSQEAQDTFLKNLSEEDQDAFYNLNQNQRKEIIGELREEYDEAVSKWFEFSEYLTVEIDTEAGTCTVVR